MHDAKWRFVQAQVLAASVRACLQRADAYAPRVTDDQRRRLHGELTAALLDIGGRYHEAVPGSQHEQHILELMKRVTGACAPVLAEGHLRLGIAQKALNLYLKYLWCLGRIPTPPHCPFDRRVIARLPAEVRVAWTQVDDLDSYRAIVKAAEVAAGGGSLAEWELRTYQGV